jgi:hypothetical protein
MSYRIMGSYRGKTEEIDHAEMEKNALYLRCEYQIAFGLDWHVWAEVKQNGKWMRHEAKL